MTIAVRKDVLARDSFICISDVSPVTQHHHVTTDHHCMPRARKIKLVTIRP